MLSMQGTSGISYDVSPRELFFKKIRLNFAARYLFICIFFFFVIIVRDLYTIFFLTKSAKKVRLLFLRGLQARRDFFEEMDFRLKYHLVLAQGASLARAPAGPTCTMPDSSTQGSIHSTFHPFRRSA